MLESIRNAGLTVLFFILLAALACFSYTDLLTTPVYMIDAMRRDSGWYHVVHTASLAFHTWPLPFYTGEWNQIVYSTLFLAAAYCFLSTLALSKNNPNLPVWLWTTVPLALFLLCGFDIVICSALLCFALLQCALQILHNELNLKNILSGFLLSILAALIAASISPLLFLIALALILDRRSTESVTVRHWLYIILLAIPPCVATVLTVEPIFPEYPRVMHLHPLATAFGPLQPIDREFIRAFWGIIILCIGGYLPILFYTHRRALFSHTHVTVTLVLYIMLLIDTRFPEEISQQGPLMGISRIFPDLYFIPLTAIITFIVIHLCIKNCSITKISAYYTGLYTFCLPFIVALLATSTTRMPLYLMHSKKLPEHCYNSDIIASPSYKVLVENGLFYLCNSGPLKTIRLNEQNAIIKTSLKNRPKRAKRILDGSSHTRWYSRQTGQEWIQIELDKPKTIAGIRLLQGNWPDDTGQKVALSIARSCSPEPARIALVAEPGTPVINITKDGFPFIDTTSSTVGLWEPEEAIQCILIRQLEKSKRNWTVSSIEIFTTE